MLEYATLGEMADQVGRQIQNTTAAKAVAIKEWINNHYAQVARGHRWKELLRISEEQFSLSSGQKYLYLTKEVEQVYLIFPQNGMPPLQGRSIEQLIDQFQSNYDISGTTVSFGEAGEVGYRTDFYTTGERLVITHSGTGTIEAVIRGLVGGAEGIVASTEITEVISVLQGSGGTTTNTFTDLGAVSVAALASGDVVTVTGVTTGRIYALVASGERTARYKRIRLMQPPQTGDAVTLVWKKHVARLANDNQAIEIPVAQVVIDDTVATMLSQQKEYAGATLHFQRSKMAREELKNAEESNSVNIQQAIPGISLTRGYRYGGGNY